MNESARAGADLQEELRIIARLREGDRTAFAQLYRWYADPLYRQVLMPRLGRVEDVEEVLKDTFRTVLEKIESFQEQGKSIWWWIRRIAINKAMDVHRKTARRRKLTQMLENVPEAPSESPERPLELSDLKKAVEISLSRLNPRYAKALRLRLLEDRSREECAEALGVKVATFDVLLHRASKAFRQEYPP